MRVAIVGAKVAFASSQAPRLSLEELIYETVKNTLHETGIRISDVDQVAIASSDGLDGRAISSMVTSGSVGGYRKSIINSSSAGEHAMILGALQIMAGRSRICLVANWSKPSEAPGREVDTLSFDPLFYRALRLSRAEIIELQVEAMLEALPVDRGWIRRMERSRSTKPDARGPRDGAVALVLTHEDVARQLGLPYSTIAGFGWASDTYWRDAHELASLPSLASAARLAYRMARIDTPRTAIGLIEVMDFSPVHLLMIYHALGLCRADELTAFADALATHRTSIDVNPSGGLAARDIDFASGLAAIATTHIALVKESTSRLGLAHAASTNAAQANSVFVLQGRGAA